MQTKMYSVIFSELPALPQIPHSEEFEKEYYKIQTANGKYIHDRLIRYRTAILEKNIDIGRIILYAIILFIIFNAIIKT
mgnify:CR=1 FL=1